MQERGFNGFSYADVARELGVTKAALHYHFASKAELGDALIDRYAERFFAALVHGGRRREPTRSRSCAPTRSCTPTSSATTGCACAACWRPTTRPCRSRCASAWSGSSTTTRSGSPASSRTGGRRGRSGSRPARPVARTLIGGLEGAMLVARPYRDLKRFRDAAELLIAGLAVERLRRSPLGRSVSSVST